MGLDRDLSRRERQIMEILFRRNRATAAEVMDELSDAPSYSAVRAHLRILCEKGHAAFDKVGPRYVYRPTISREQAKSTALDHVVETFFGGSVAGAVAALLDERADALPKAELDRLGALIEDARREGR